MSIKRYNPKYKVLSRYRQPIWLEKRVKIKKLKRRKWDGIKKFYFPRKYVFFNQDVSSCMLANDYEQDRTLRLKKTYKFLLQDKQRLQLYYGGNRVKFFQLKKLAREVIRLSQRKNLSSAKSFLHNLEARLDVSLYRLGVVSSLMQARRVINSGFIHVSSKSQLKASKIALKESDSLKIDPAFFFDVLGRYLKVNAPFFYFRNKKNRKQIIFERKDSFYKSFLERNNLFYLKRLKAQLVSLKQRQKNKI